MFGKKKEEKPIRYLGLDIGTEYIKAILFRVEDGSIVVEHFLRVKQKMTAMKNGTITNIRNVISACEEALSGLDTEDVKIVGSFIGIAGELVKGVPLDVSYKREGGIITEKEIEDVISKIEPDAYEEAKEIYRKSTGRETVDEFEIKLTNITVVQSKVDGFEVENPVGIEGTKVFLKAYFTFAPQLHINYVSSVSEALGIDVLGIMAEPFALARSIKKYNEKLFSGIIIDIGGGTTDIAVVKDGIVMNTQMFAFGGRVFTKRIAADLNVSLEEAENLKIKYSSKEISVTKLPEVKAAILKDVPVWVSGVEIALSEFLDDVTSFPATIYLCGGGALLGEIKEALIEHPWTQVLPFQRAPKVYYLSLNELDGIKDETGELNKPEYVPSLAISRYALEVVSND
jgi:cell division protein FtsA